MQSVMLVLVPVFILGMVVPADSRWAIAPKLGIAWAVLIGLMGAALALLLPFTSFRLGCPRCNSKTEIQHWGKDGLHLDCPKCGLLHMKPGSPFGLQVTERNEDEYYDDDDSDDADEEMYAQDEGPQ